MDRRELGGTGLQVSAIGLGTVKIGRNTGVKYPQPFALPSDEDVVSLLEHAREIGINLLDTAPAYGTSETRLGRLLPEPRSDWIISTKVGEIFEHNQSRFDFSPEHIRRSIDASCRKLKRDSLDIVLIHSDGANESQDRFGPALDELNRLKDLGRIRAIGMSCKTLQGARLGIELGDCIMVTLNQRDQAALPAIREASERNIGVLVKKGLSSGHFAQPTGDRPDAGKHANDYKNENKNANGSEHHDPVASAMRFVFAQPGVTSLVVGTMNPSHLSDNVRTYDAVTRRP